MRSDAAPASDGGERERPWQRQCEGCGKWECVCPRCPECGYSKWDAAFHGDHYLCQGSIPGQPAPAPAAGDEEDEAEANRLRNATADRIRLLLQEVAGDAWENDDTYLKFCYAVDSISGTWRRSLRSRLSEQEARIEVLERERDAAWDVRNKWAGRVGDVEAENRRLRDFIADDAVAATYQSLGQYRTALLRALRPTSGAEGEGT